METTICLVGGKFQAHRRCSRVWRISWQGSLFLVSIFDSRHQSSPWVHCARGASCHGPQTRRCRRQLLIVQVEWGACRDRPGKEGARQRCAAPGEEARLASCGAHSCVKSSGKMKRRRKKELKIIAYWLGVSHVWKIYVTPLPFGL
jgi:hypothetical protein